MNAWMAAGAVVGLTVIISILRGLASAVAEINIHDRGTDND